MQLFTELIVGYQSITDSIHALLHVHLYPKIIRTCKTINISLDI